MKNRIPGDPRLVPLLKRSLPHARILVGHGYGGSVPVSTIVQDFIGEPKDLFVDDDRYVHSYWLRAARLPHQRHALDRHVS